MPDSVDSELTYDDLIHDLNNVFETITDAAELLRRDKRWSPLAATLARSVNRGKRLLGAIPDRTPNLSAIVGDSIQSITDYCVAARKPRLKFVLQINDEIRLPGSSKDWERVFENLFLNAAQVMRKPGRIDICAQQSEGTLTITVADNGPGIRADILPRLFRADVSTKNNAKTRCGLGLHIVDSIVKKHGGRVHAANREGVPGAVFTLSVPSI
jgi:signal transduction histidine kinase